MRPRLLPSLALLLVAAGLQAAPGGLSLRERLALRRGYDAADRDAIGRAQLALSTADDRELQIRTFTPQQWAGTGPFKSTKYDADNWVDVADLNKGDWVMVNSTNVIVGTAPTPGRELATVRFKDYEDVLSGVFEFGVPELVARFEPPGGRPSGPLVIAKFDSNPTWKGRTYRRVPQSAAFPTGFLMYRTFTEKQDEAAKQARRQRDADRFQAKVDALRPWMETWKKVVGVLPPGQWVPMGNLRPGDIVLWVGEPRMVHQVKGFSARDFQPPDATSHAGYANVEVYCGSPRGLCDFTGWDVDDRVRASTRVVVRQGGFDQAQIYRVDPSSPEGQEGRRQGALWRQGWQRAEAEAAATEQRRREEAYRAEQERLARDRELAEIQRRNAAAMVQSANFQRNLSSGSSARDVRDQAWWSSYRKFEAARTSGNLPSSARFDPNKSW